MVTRQTTFKIDGIREDSDTGFVSGSVLATKIGVFNYRDSATGDVIRELRPPEEVFSTDSMKSLQNKPWTNNHPPVKVNKRNIKKYGTGFLHGEVSIHNDEFLKSEFTIQDSDNIEAFNNGKKGVSCGYDCVVVKKSGVWRGQKYDAIQTKIRYNHISSVNNPRLTGSEIITDADEPQYKFDAIEVNEQEGLPPSNETEKKQSMIKIKIDNHDVEVSEGAKIAIENKLKSDSDNLKQIQKKLDSALKEIETLKGQNEALTNEVEEAKKIDVNDLMKKRRKLEKEVSPFLNKETLEKIDEMEEFELIKSAIASKYDSVDLEGKSNEAILGMFEIVKNSTPVKKEDGAEIYDKAVPASSKKDGFDWDSDPLSSKEGN